MKKTISLFCFMCLLLTLTACGKPDSAETSTAASVPVTQPTEVTTSIPSESPAEAAESEPDSSSVPSSEDPLFMANALLGTSGYSRSGIYTALTEMGFDPIESLNASEACDIDLKAEAKLAMCRNLLAFGISKRHLEIEMICEGFSDEEITEAFNSFDVDWVQEAAEAAEWNLLFKNYTYDQMVRQLVIEGFTEDQAAKGAAITMK